MKKILLTLAIVLSLSTCAFAKSVTFNWTAPSDNPSGNVAGYQLVYSEQPITEANYDLATVLVTDPAKASGQQESYVYDLPANKQYYIAVKSFDVNFNKSAMSNVVIVDFLGPNPITNLTFTLQ